MEYNACTDSHGDPCGYICGHVSAEDALRIGAEDQDWEWLDPSERPQPENVWHGWATGDILGFGFADEGTIGSWPLTYVDEPGALTKAPRKGWKRATQDSDSRGKDEG